jgi:hypothetical protein
VLELTQVVEDEPAPLPMTAEPAQAPQPAGDEIGFDDSLLVSPPTANTASGSFSALTSAVSGIRAMGLGDGHRTIEELVKELLRPMLKQWLDANLAQIVQRVVEREVARISGRAERLPPD